MRSVFYSWFFILTASLILLIVSYWNYEYFLIQNLTEKLKSKRFVEDYYAGVSLKVKRKFPLTFEDKCVLYTPRNFSLYVTILNKTNTILGENFSVNFTSDFRLINISMCSQNYSFLFNKDYSIINSTAPGDVRFMFFYNGVLKGDYNISHGNFTLNFSNNKVINISYRSCLLLIMNLPNYSYKVCFNQSVMQTKELRWKIKIEKWNVNYRGFIRWR